MAAKKNWKLYTGEDVSVCCCERVRGRSEEEEERETYRVEAEAMFSLAAKWVISYAVGMPRSEKALGSVAERARFAKRPNRYSVFISLPSNVRVISTRPWTSSARRVEFIAFACEDC